jgi:hypothetical protein
MRVKKLVTSKWWARKAPPRGKGRNASLPPPLEMSGEKSKWSEADLKALIDEGLLQS